MFLTHEIQTTFKQQIVKTMIIFQVAAGAFTGIAANLLEEGRTVHGLFKLPVPLLETSSCKVAPPSQYAEFLRQQVAFIIDEASMIPSLALHAIDR